MKDPERLNNTVESIQLWSRVKEDALLEYAIDTIEKCNLTYEEVRRIRLDWKAVSPTEDESSEDYEMFEKLEELTSDWEETLYWKHEAEYLTQQEEDVDES